MKLTPKDVEVVVAARFKLTLDQIRSLDQHFKICRPRQIAMFLAREVTGKSFPYLGRHFGRDHTTVYNGCKRVRQIIGRSQKIAGIVDELRETLLALEASKTAETRKLVERLHQGEVSWREQQEAA